MIHLSLDSINKRAPYQVSELRDNYFEFTSEAGVKFRVGFDADDLIVPQEDVYQLLIMNVNHKSSPRDARVRDTIIAIVSQFFLDNNSVMLYICETGDGKQAQRNRLFEYWFSTYLKQNEFTFLHTSVKDLEGVDNYAALIIRNDNPRLPIILAKFADTVHILNNKPE